MSERPKVQHSKCCVVSQPPWVQIPALPPLPPGPIGAGRFCYAYVACCIAVRCVAVLLVAPRVFRAPEAPAAREARRPHSVRCRASKPARALRSLRRPPHQWCQVADVWLGALSRCPARPRHRPRVSHLGPVDQTARLSETLIAFARSCSSGIETASAFACWYSCGVETAVAFAGAKWVFLARFSAALVLSVSMVAVQGRALVMVVSCWPASVLVEVSLVASSPRGCVLCAKKFALRGHNGPKLVFSSVLGEHFRGRAAGGGVLGEFFRESAAVGSHGASCVVP